MTRLEQRKILVERDLGVQSTPPIDRINGSIARAVDDRRLALVILASAPAPKQVASAPKQRAVALKRGTPLAAFSAY